MGGGAGASDYGIRHKNRCVALTQRFFFGYSTSSSRNSRVMHHSPAMPTSV